MNWDWDFLPSSQHNDNWFWLFLTCSRLVLAFRQQQTEEKRRVTRKAIQKATTWTGFQWSGSSASQSLLFMQQVGTKCSLYLRGFAHTGLLCKCLIFFWFVCFPSHRSCRLAPLIQCNYCPLLFHMDCLDPPLTALPAGKWMCPNHVEHLVVRGSAGLVLATVWL